MQEMLQNCQDIKSFSNSDPCLASAWNSFVLEFFSLNSCYTLFLWRITYISLSPSSQQFLQKLVYQKLCDVKIASNTKELNKLFGLLFFS